MSIRLATRQAGSVAYRDPVFGSRRYRQPAAARTDLRRPLMLLPVIAPITGSYHDRLSQVPASVGHIARSAVAPHR